MLITEGGRMKLLLLMCAVAGLVCAQQRQFKTQAEYDAYNDVAKDLAANNPQRAIADLDTWKQKFPDSDFKDDRTALYVQALAATNQPAKAMDVAADVIGKELSPNVLYMIAQAIQRAPDPTPAQLQTGAKAARALQAFEKAPEGVTAEQWAQARKEMEATAKAALLYIDLIPSTQALKKKECAEAETLARKAIDDFPMSGQAAWSLGSAAACAQKIPLALYEFARASSLDAKAAMVDPKWQQGTADPYLQKLFAQYHGADPEGLKQLRALAVKSPLPPADFELKSLAEIEGEKIAQFRKENPEVALWIDVKASLKAENGPDYFESSLKDAGVPKLIGVVMDARPACNAKELLVAVRQPDTLLEGEILLKLEKPVTGTVDPQSAISWEGTATAFVPKPFLLTMSVEQTKLTGFKLSPCAKKKN
jgi:hypothetical protein